jgi:hypothetical protein
MDKAQKSRDPEGRKKICIAMSEMGYKPSMAI